MVKIMSLNVSGLQNNSKCKQMYLFIIKQNVDIAVIQETHSSPQSQDIWQSEWGGNIIWDHGTSDSRGVAIMCNPTLQCEINKISTSKQG